MVTYSFSLRDFEFFLAIMVRIATFLFAAPLYSMRGVPARVKVGLSFFVSVLLFQSLPRDRLEYVDVIGFAILMIKEALAGLCIGFLTNACTYILGLAGQFIDQHIGLTMAQEFNPMTQTQTAITGNFYNYVVIMLLLVTGLDHYLIRALTETYELIPVGGVVFQTDNMVVGILQFLTDMFVLAFRIALPVFACIMILNSILGIMAKVAPQMNMFSVGMQLKVITGYLILILTVQVLPYVSDFIYTEIKKMMVTSVGILGG
ncbi:MAG: flagellar biosynthetic protein FliR [Lachnospiraceae bacterium]|nr:flagellar biosynthetic protein FliR [Lachnospiraceae bacterium]